MLMYAESVLPNGTKPFRDKFKLQILDQGDLSSKVGNIILTDDQFKNCRLIKAKIMDIGSQANDLDLQVGDVVLYDKFAAYYRPDTTVGTDILIDYVNIICKVDSDGIKPFGENLMIEAIEHVTDHKMGNMLLSDAVTRSTENVVVCTGVSNGCPSNVGDNVVVYSNGTVRITYASKKYVIVPYECVVAQKIKLNK
jgi:co-chaperonin GroES (HSP10)